MKRILTIDGGGIRGVFPAAFLAELENDLECPIGEYFDLISGTSTGGIIAIGLGLGLTASDILDLYETEGPAIFAQAAEGFPGWLTRRFNGAKWAVWGPKYSTEPLKRALENTLGKRRLGEASTRLMIPAWNADRQGVYIFKTAHHERLTTDYKSLAVDVALATAAAPTYFRQHITANDVGLVDGGIWANNPTGIAIVEAIGVLDWEPEEIQVLSVGCLEDVRTMREAYGAATLLPSLAGLFMDGQSHSSMGIAQILLGDPHDRQAIHRVTQAVPDGFYKMDDTSRIRSLKGRAFSEARERKPILKPVFFAEPAEKFTPIYRCKDGHN